MDNSDNQLDSIKNEILDFIEDFESKYDKTVQVILNNGTSLISTEDIIELENMSKLEKIEALVLKAMYAESPQLLYIKNFKNPTRRGEYILWKQIFSYIAWDIGFSKSIIGRYIDRNHATVIHSIKTAENLLSVEDHRFTEAYYSVINNIKDYVGIVAKNTKTRHNAKSVLNSLRDQKESVISVS